MTADQQTSRRVISNQSGPHERLEEIVRRHSQNPSQKPIADHSRKAFQAIEATINGAGGRYILDACCGVGDSSRALAEKRPDTLVVGIDKSAHRLSTERQGAEPDNLLLVRADLNDIYRLLAEAALKPVKHYILYPNPWPKASHFGRRWHGSPVFPDIVKLGGNLELRSNWKLYLSEFSAALKVLGHAATLESYVPTEFLTPFEAKYHNSGQPLWRLVAELN